MEWKQNKYKSFIASLIHQATAYKALPIHNKNVTLKWVQQVIQVKYLYKSLTFVTYNIHNPAIFFFTISLICSFVLGWNYLKIH